MKLKEIVERINQIAPFSTQESYDNSGLLVGDPEREIHAVHLALDCTMAVTEEAISLGADLIITHHPLMFSAIQTLREDRTENRILCRLIRENMALISAHTCLDKAPGGINDVLAQTIGLENITGDGFLRAGELPMPVSAACFENQLSERLHTVVRRMGRADAEIHRVCVCSGAGSEEWEDALAMGADAFISGEIKHHHALAAAAHGMTCFECGHFATENPGIFALEKALQTGPDGVEWKIRVTRSGLEPYCG